MPATQTLANWLAHAQKVTVFTGAGMSTESGLPDFRSAQGLWTTNRRFEELASIQAIDHFYDEFVDFYRGRIRQLQNYEPNEGHQILARWQAQQRVKTLITQNVDGFHQRAGSLLPLQLHGGLDHVRCHSCGHSEPASLFLTTTRCAACGGKLRPGVVLFGEALPLEALTAAQVASHQSDLFIVLGSSLTVSPANTLPEIALAAGAKLAIINHEETPLTANADLSIFADIGPTLAAVDAELR
jgi:NAD-dependent deacetylase